MNHKIPQRLVMVIYELQNNWDEQLTSSLRTKIRSALPPVQLPTKSTWLGFRDSLSRFLGAPGSPATRAWPATSSPTAAWGPTASSSRTVSSVHTTPSQFVAWNAATQPSSTHCTRFPKSPLVVGCDRTIRLPPFANARRWTRTPTSSRSSSCSTELASTESSQLAPVTPLTHRTAPLSALSSYVWIYPPTCPARMLSGTFQYKAASPVTTPMTMATYRSIC